MFDDAGVSPADLKSLDDVARFPFTVKDDLRLNYPFDLFAVPRARVIRIHASSGTTGIPTVVGYTRADLDMWAGSWPAACAPPARAPATWCTSLTATGSSPAVSASTAAPRSWAAP